MNYNFKQIIENNSLHHAYIFEGPYSMDKFGYAKGVVKKILCKVEKGVGCNRCETCRKIEDDNHIDIFVIEPTQEKDRKVKSVKDKQIEELQERLARKPFDCDRNIAIIKGADSVTVKAFNRLLKTIEEPPEGTVIILLSENINNLPQTIRSRCVHIRLNDYSYTSESYEGRKEAEELIMLLVDGDYFYKVKNLVDGFVKDPEGAYLLLDNMEIVYRNLILGKHEDYRRFNKEYIFKAFKAIEEARKDVQRNMNVSYAMRKMLLNIGG